MNLKEINIAIAEACGWAKEHKGLWVETLNTYAALPDYLNDLNACHEMEKALPRDGTRLAYVEMLAIFQTDHHPFFSTSQERAEAIGLTLNLWTAEE